MATIFGICRPRGTPIEEHEMRCMASATANHAVDGTSLVVSDHVGMGYQPYHTHVRSTLDRQPLRDGSGNLLVFDGRLDNWAELRQALDVNDEDISTSQMILAAFSRWGEACFRRFLGDWALAIWSSTDNQLYLARDHAGARTLYFSHECGTVQWSTYLDTFFSNGKTFEVDERYAARYLSSRPVIDATPYQGIRAVRPAHYLIFHGDRIISKPHWDWFAKGRICYRTDAEYEAHFLAVFRQAVRRRTAEGDPLIAELSGGMDSSSIVCMSDDIRREQGATSVRLIDTISYYDNTEPNWDEKPYFSKIEEVRQKVGIHVPVSFLDRTLQLPVSSTGRCHFPGVDNGLVGRERRLEDLLAPAGYRVVISGIGGDELLGGVPTGLPELADHLFYRELRRFTRQAIAWCLPERMPMIQLLRETIGFAAALYLPLNHDRGRMPPWVTQGLRKRYDGWAPSTPRKAWTPSIPPSTISNGLTWWHILETLPHIHPGYLTRYEYRYPYLDRDLVDFLFRICRQQITRPGRRRSLMRRALVNIVPQEILERRRKAFLIRGPMAMLQQQENSIRTLFVDSLAAQWGFIDANQFRTALDHTIRHSDPRWVLPIIKAISFEMWLRTDRPSTSGPTEPRIFGNLRTDGDERIVSAHKFPDQRRLSA
jgi:asparagine synthase (glutamine-hydrolysing)